MEQRILHHRRSIRLKGYDYSLPGAYFITLVTKNRANLFGQVEDGGMNLSIHGMIAKEQWYKTATLRPCVRSFEDEFVVMPNHIHGIIHLTEDDVGARRRRAPTDTKFGKPKAMSISTIVGAYKSAVTYAIHRLPGCADLAIWQRNYYEHIVQDHDDWQTISTYIQSNPACWTEDNLYAAIAGSIHEKLTRMD